MFEIVDGLHQPEAAHDELHAVLLDDLAADVEVALRDALHHLLQRHVRARASSSSETSI